MAGQSRLRGAIASVPPEAAAALIGPNAVTQIANALHELCGPETARDIFAGGGLQGMLAVPPTAMVDERAVIRLFECVHAGLPPDTAAAVAARAGRRTADYLLAHRIPHLAQRTLQLLPASLAARLLLRAVARNAWTFVGSGTFSAQPGSPIVIDIRSNPLATPGCAWHVAVFERLFRALVAPRSVVRHQRCCYDGAASCRFEIAIDGADTQDLGFQNWPCTHREPKSGFIS